MSFRQDNLEFENVTRAMESLDNELDRVIHMAKGDRAMLVGAVCLGEPVLLEAIQGTGKTLTAKSVATAIGGSFGRIQGMPDKLPADVTGGDIFDPVTRTFRFHEGPIFNNVVLADEINRNPPKTQASLLEAMEEGQVTSFNETHTLPTPFFLIATQNRQEVRQGTFPLTNANSDRFGISIEIPRFTELDHFTALSKEGQTAKQVLEPEDLPGIADAIHRTVKAGALEVVGRATGLHLALQNLEIVDLNNSSLGGQRPVLDMLKFSKILAAREGHLKVEPKHIDQAAEYVLRHRTALTFSALNRGDTVQQAIEDAKRSASSE